MRKDTKKHRGLMHMIELGYWVSPQGQVYSPKGKPLNGCVGKNNKTGYAQHIMGVKDPVSKTTTTVATASLVAVLKFGEDAYLAAECVRHLDGDSLNNSYENIAIGSLRENQMDIPEVQRQERSRLAAKTRGDAIYWPSIITDRENGYSHEALAQKWSIGQSSVSRHFKKYGDPLSDSDIRKKVVNWGGVFTALAYGLTIKETARAYGSTESSVRGMLSRSGIKTKRGKVLI